jgi:hypothetical protein
MNWILKKSARDGESRMSDRAGRREMSVLTGRRESRMSDRADRRESRVSD